MKHRASDVAGGGMASVGMTRISYPRSPMTTPSPIAAEPYPSRSPDVRAAVLPIVLRLTQRFLNPGAGVASKDSYVLNVRKDIAKGKANPVGMIAAIAYDDIQKGRSAADVKSWLLELAEEIDCWERERDGQRLSPPDLTPLLRIEARREGQENESAVMAGADQDNPEKLEKLIEDTESEMAASADIVEAARARLCVVRRNPTRRHA